MEILKKLNHIFRLIDAAYLFRNEEVNDQSMRSFMRVFFIQIDNLTKVAPRAKNELFRSGAIDKALKEELEALNSKLVASYENSYDIIRDKLTAHAQPIDLISIQNWWNAIDYSAIEVLYGDVKEIQSALERGRGVKFLAVPDYAPIPIPLGTKLSRGDVAPQVASDRLAFAKPNTTYLIPCHESQEKAQTILSVVEFLETDYAITVITNNPTTIYTTLIFELAWTLAVVDICSLIDNLFESNQYDRSLLEYWQGDIAGHQFLASVSGSRDHSLEKKIREARNTFAAHIDDAKPLEDVRNSFWGIDLMAAHAYTSKLVNAFRNACAMDIRTRMFLIQNVPLSGVISIPNATKPFES
jgi:hypothetical protein